MPKIRFMAPAQGLARALAAACALIVGLALAASPAADRTPSDAPARAEPDPAPGRFLVASESIRDPRFHRSVILMVTHGDEGSLGVILNRPGDVPLSELLEDGGEGQLHYGGPVQPRILSVLFRPDADGVNDADGGGNADEGSPDAAPADIIHIPGGIEFALGHRAVTRILQRLDATAPRRVFSGYAGWSPGQLQGEIASGGWHVVDESPDEVFSDPADIWDRLMRAFRGRWI